MIQDMAAGLAKVGGKLLSLPILGFPLFTFMSALAIASGYVLVRHARHRGSTRARVYLRAMFPDKLVASASGHVDIAFAVFNSLALSFLCGWMLLSGLTVAEQSRIALEHLFGARAPSTLPTFLLAMIGATVATVVYEFGYWIDHWLKHRVPFLWEFHKVHHTAEHLSFLTQYRVHPVDTVILVNILALTGGFAQGATSWAFGRMVEPLSFAGSNIFMLAGLMTFVHLQHTAVWIAFTGIWGHFILSPAHHQLHHSDDPAHHGCNLGSMFGIFDWLFGTLLVPAARPRTLRFGVGPEDATAGDIVGSFCLPFVRAWRGLVPNVKEATVRESPLEPSRDVASPAT